MTIIEKALEIATRAHAGQTRRDGSPYINHPVAVADLVEGSWSISARENKSVIYNLSIALAFLHDGPEDAPDFTEIKILREFEDTGLIEPASLTSEYLYKGLILLNKNNYNSYTKYISAIDRDNIGLAKKVKIADLTHNLSDLKPGTLRDKYELAKYILEN
jgi:guanosine-3',5'-bis(diphosphate) 3'-pyrophosphohydrolase